MSQELKNEIVTDINLWKYGFILIIIGIVMTIIPIMYAFFKRIKLDKPKFWFEEANFLGKNKERLIACEGRIQGTLIFWKNKAEAHRKLHIANVLWGLISAVSLPVLIQFYDKTDSYSLTFMTVLTFWTGLIFAISHTLKSESKYQGYRSTESDYYDSTRELLDTPERDEKKLEHLVNEHIDIVEKIRQVARGIETGTPPSARI